MGEKRKKCKNVSFKIGNQKITQKLKVEWRYTRKLKVEWIYIFK